MNVISSITNIKDWEKIKLKYKNILIFIWSKDIHLNYNDFIQNVNLNLKNNIKLFQLEILENSNMIEHLDITSYPCLRYYKNSNLINEYFFLEKYINNVNIFLKNINS